ncbi:MAG: hypothetical protein GXZ04_06025 [Clostridiales bacterium]|nr:hypothetical protein [Clostridiales bacterium]
MKVLENQFKIMSSDCDRYGHLKMNRVLVIMQELAGEHSDKLGWSFENTLKHNAVWVVTRNEFLIERYPTIGQAVRGISFPGRARRGIYPRYYLIEDEQGQALIRGSSFWVLADVHTRQMTDIKDIMEDFPDTSALAPFFHNPGTADELVEGVSQSGVWHPVFTELDRNGHVNNTHAAERALCFLNEAADIAQHPVRAVRVSYHKEMMAGDAVDMAFVSKDLDFSLRCDIKGELALRLSGNLF